MDSVLEEKRSLHEERDRIELAIVNEMLSKKTGHRDRLDSEHRQKALLDRYQKCSKSLLVYYQREAEIPPKLESDGDEQDPGRQARCPPGLESDEEQNNLLKRVFKEFYLALKEVNEFYNNENSNEQVVTLASEFEELEAARQIALGIKTRTTGEESQQLRRVDDDPLQGESDSDHETPIDPHAAEKEAEMQRLTRGLPTTDLVDIVQTPAPQSIIRPEKLVEFTDEEGYGRYLDLTKSHEAFLQVIKHEERKPNYLVFLDKFDRFADLDRDCKLTGAYKTYVNMLLDYFRDYCKRARPLLDYQKLEALVDENFVKNWKDKILPGWFTDSDRLQAQDQAPMVDLESYRNPGELMELGLDCLKRELQARGLKCGGTLEERAYRLWSVRGKSNEEIDDSLRAGARSKKGKKRSTIDPFTIASIEAKLLMYAEYFNDHRQATIENVQRKQARTAEERNESDEDISDIEDDDNDQGDVIYNPKNLPLGWDGKPIPYWLYKLHGLNITFTCEICGNATYKGPKTFQRHFAEWRHAHGMRCLGIPNTAHFANITKIQDAISLWDQLKNERQKDKFQPLNEEEYEDSQGNVVNKKTYEDLKRQGLL